jgi:tetratricopeptide (TPR) repeat protein
VEQTEKNNIISTADWLKLVVVAVLAVFLLYRCLLPFRAEYAFREAYNFEAQSGNPNLPAEVRAADAQKAIDKYLLVKKLAPWETYYHTQLARIYENQARAESDPAKKLELIQKADEIYDLCLKISPTNPWYVIRKAEMYGMRAELETDPDKKAELYTQREELTLQASAYDPNNAIFTLSAANLYLGKRDYANALEKYQHVLVIDDRMGDAYMMLAELYKQQGDPAKQEEMYRACIAKAPDYRNARLQLGLLYEQQGRLKDAINLYKGEALLDKNNEYTFRLLGAACYRDSQWVNMEIAFNRLTMINPNSPDYYVYRAQAQIRQGKTPEAIASLEAALVLQPDNTLAKTSLSSLKYSVAPLAAPASAPVEDTEQTAAE